MAEAVQKVTELPSAEEQFLEKEQDKKLQTDFKQETHKEMGKVALIISILAVLLVAILFFGVNQNVKGVAQEVAKLQKLPEKIAILSGTVQEMGTKVNTLDAKVARLEDLPQKTKNTIIANALEDMAAKTKYLATQVDNQEQANKLAKIQELLDQVQKELGESLNK